jgi:GPH family glycoside/pentoside/hexuronide:cation symporter
MDSSPDLSPPGDRPLDWRAIGAYAFGAAGVAFATNLVAFYFLKFATDVLLLAPGVIGAIFAASRVWDAVAGPLAGYWSDRTRSRLGRRRPWLLAGALPFALAFGAIWSPPSALAGPALVVWMAVAVLAFYTAQTACSIPHIALGAELTRSHHDRTRVFGGRTVAEIAGVMAAAGALYALERADDVRGAARAIALLGGAGAVALLLVTAASVRERPEHRGRGGQRPYVAFRDVLRNPHARLLLGAACLEAVGFATLTTVMPFATEYLLGLHGMTSIFLALALVSMVASVPVWIPLSRRFGKARLWTLSIWARAAAFGGLWFVDAGQPVALYAAIAVIGCCYGCGNVVAPSIKADIVDHDESLCGERKEGTFFSAWNFSAQTATALAVLLVALALEAAGFRPGAAQPPRVDFALRALFALSPALFHLFAALLLRRFAFGEREHAAVQAALAGRALSAER